MHEEPVQDDDESPETNNSVDHDADQSVVTWLREALGANLLAYLLGCEVQSIPSLAYRQISFTVEQRSILSELATLREQIPHTLGDVPVAEIMATIVTQLDQSGRSVARALRLRVIGREDIPTGQDELERCSIGLALDVYPVLLLPPESDPLPMPIGQPANFRLSSLIFHHPQAKAFTEAALRDATLKSVFTHEDDHSGRSAMVYRNTGSGGGLQLMLLPDMILRNAWQHLEGHDTSPEMFVNEAVNELRAVRSALAGKGGTATAKVAFAGVLLPPGEQFNVGNGTVRAVTDADRRFAPESLKQQLTGTDSTVINYDGDVLLEYKFPYKVRVFAYDFMETRSSWPQDMLPPSEIEQVVRRLRFSLMVAVERDSRVQIVPTWRAFDEPLNQGSSIGWSDPREGGGITATQLTSEEVATWREWYAYLDNHHVNKIELALTRILRAAAERREPSDVLIDSVIAWENLFGTREGEPTFRVSTCLAKLLAQSVEERLSLKKKFSDIYSLRSKVVHGGRDLKREENPLCYEALDVAIHAVKVLVSERADILALGDGASRSAVLLLRD